MFMKKVIITLVCILTCFHLFPQQITLDGQVSMHNSKYNTGKIQYVKDAYVTASFAAPDDTDTEGRFCLVFVGIKSGVSVKVTVEKAGLEVVNTRDLEQVIIGRKDVLRVYLAAKGELARCQGMVLYSKSRGDRIQKDGRRASNPRGYRGVV
jgi:hypothetical protein